MDVIRGVVAAVCVLAVLIMFMPPSVTEITKLLQEIRDLLKAIKEQDRK